MRSVANRAMRRTRTGRGAATVIFLYTFVLAVLGTVKALFAWRARGYETRYAKAALAVEKLARGPDKGGTNRIDAAAAAKRQYQLGALVQVRDALQAKH